MALLNITIVEFVEKHLRKNYTVPVDFSNQGFARVGQFVPTVKSEGVFSTVLSLRKLNFLSLEFIKNLTQISEENSNRVTHPRSVHLFNVSTNRCFRVVDICFKDTSFPPTTPATGCCEPVAP